MKKKMTDSELKRVISEIAQLFPEIDPGDEEWREFMRDFIAARPKVKIDEDFSAALRTELLLRGEVLDAKPKRKSNWLSMVGVFFTGAAVCAVIVVPILTVSQRVEKSAEVNEIAVASRGMPKMAMMVMDAPALEMIEGEMDMEAKELSSDFGEAITMMQEPMMNLALEDGMVGGMGMRVMREPLLWDEMPSDETVIEIAIEFFDERGFDADEYREPEIDKWWDNGSTDALGSEYAPDQISVLFTAKNGLEDVRMEIDARKLRVVWMTYSFSKR